MTDRIIDTLARLDSPSPGGPLHDPGPGSDDVAPTAQPRRLADGALARARRRSRNRRLGVAVATPLVAAAAAVAVSVVPSSLLPDLLGSATPAATSAPARPAPWGTAARVDVLLLGTDTDTDTAAGTAGADVDTAVLASIDTRTGQTLLVGVPRNRLGLRDPAGRWRIANDAATVPVRAQVEDLTGQRVDATVTLDMAGFAQFVDAIGGVEVTVPRALAVGGSRAAGGAVLQKPSAYLPAGRQRLNGHDALWFARSRYDSDDYERMRRQRCLLGALAAQVDPTTVLVRGPQLLEALRDHVSTTIDLQDLPAWVDLFGRVRTARLHSLTLDLPVLDDGSPDVARSRSAVTAALATTTGPTSTGPTSTGPTSTGPTSGPDGTGPAAPPPGPTVQDVSAVC